MSDENTDLGHLWAVHSSKANRPIIRGWAKSEAEAIALQKKMQQNDRVPDDEYWVTQLTPSQIDSLKESGFIPKDA